MFLQRGKLAKSDLEAFVLMNCGYTGAEACTAGTAPAPRRRDFPGPLRGVQDWCNCFSTHPPLGAVIISLADPPPPCMPPCSPWNAWSRLST